MKLANTIPTENGALLPRKASPWRGLVVRAAAVSLALGLVASAATGGVSTTSLSSKKHAGKFESPKGGKYGNIKVKGGDTYLDWQKYVECWTPTDQGYYPPGALAEAKGWPGDLSKQSNWCNGIDWGNCDESVFGRECTEDDPCYFEGIIGCYNVPGAHRVLTFPAGTFWLTEQVWVPPYTKLLGASNPNDKKHPYDVRGGYGGGAQTVFWGVEADYPNEASFASFNAWCSGGRDHPLEAKLERRGFVLHSHTELKNVVILGIDVSRNSAAFCGGGAIETPGCIGQYGGGKETGANWDDMPKYSDPADRYDAQENYQDDDMDDVLYNNKNTNSQEYPVACYDNYRVMLPYTQSSTWDGHTYPIVDGSEFAIPSKYWLIGGYEPGTEVAHINIENVRINDPRYFKTSLTPKQIRHAERVCSDEGCQAVHPDTDQDFYTWPATQAALYVLPRADGGRTHHVTVKNLFSLTSVADGINVRSSGQVTFEEIFVANSGDDALALWAGAGLGDLWFKGDFIVASNPGIRQQGLYGDCFASYGGKKVVFDSFTCEDRSCDEGVQESGSSSPNACNALNGAGAVVLWDQSSFGSAYPEGNMFVFGHDGGKFVWADLKGSDKVGSYPYPKNQPDKYPYWDNLGADWFYGGIWVYRDKYSAGHPNVWKEDKEYKWDE